MKASGSTAVMARRHEPPDSLDFFPTPPWATRALIEHVLIPRGHAPQRQTVWEPAGGEHHMSGPLAEYFRKVFASDVHDYGMGDRIGSFTGAGADVIADPDEPVDWIATNPPFNQALAFALRGLQVARIGVALLLRLQWLETHERYRDLFKPTPPTFIAQFVERCPMTRGRWDPDAVSATAYTWIGWEKQRIGKGTDFLWIPPGCAERLTKKDDRAKYAAWSVPAAGDAGPLFGGAA